jgi:hypothetical protein
MQDMLAQKFVIKRVSKSSDLDYQKGLGIYNATTPSDIKTSTNEINKWLNENKQGNTFELLLFSLYYNDEVIGLAMLSYIPRFHLLIYDYIALKNEYRINAVIFSYINLIQDYMRINNYDVAYYIVEISNKNGGKSIDKESRLFKKLICLEGFGKIKAKYRTLPLGLDHYESSFEAFLYIKSNDNLNSISKETFIDFVHAIYYEYYLTWYTPILSSEKLKALKEEKIDRYYNMLKEDLSEEIQFEIEYAYCPLLGNISTEKTYGYLPSKPQKSISKYLLMLLLVLLSPLCLVLGYNFVFDKLGIPINTVNTIVGATFAAILSSLTAFIVAKNKRL